MKSLLIKQFGELEEEIIRENNLENYTDAQKEVQTELDENGAKVKLIYVVEKKIGTKEKIGDLRKDD